MVQPWISYKNIKRIGGALAILLAIGVLYGICSDINLFLHGDRFEGTVIQERHYYRSGTDYTITYSRENQVNQVSQNSLVDGSGGYSIGDKVAIFVEHKYPSSFTISKISTISLGGYLVDHLFFIFRLIFVVIFVAVGIMWMFKSPKVHQITT